MLCSSLFIITILQWFLLRIQINNNPLFINQPILLIIIFLNCSSLHIIENLNHCSIHWLNTAFHHPFVEIDVINRCRDNPPPSSKSQGRTKQCIQIYNCDIPNQCVQLHSFTSRKFFLIRPSQPDLVWLFVDERITPSRCHPNLLNLKQAKKRPHFFFFSVQFIVILILFSYSLILPSLKPIRWAPFTRLLSLILLYIHRLRRHVVWKMMEFDYGNHGKYRIVLNHEQWIW